MVSIFQNHNFTVNLSGPDFVESTEDFADQWKVLVYDQDCRDIISPLMNVGALRQKGVTLHMTVSLIFVFSYPLGIISV